jgi:uncharacterized protein YkwD
MEFPTSTNTIPALPTLTQTVTRTAIPTNPPPTRAPTLPGSGCVPVFNSGFEAQLLVLINAERAKAVPPLPPLIENSALDASAHAHSLDMSVNNYMAHTGLDGSTYWQREVAAGYSGRWGGEIIYAGSGSYNNPASAVHWWMNDPPHATLIMDLATWADYSDFGAGYAYCSTSDYGAYFTVDFGHR